MIRNIPFARPLIDDLEKNVVLEVLSNPILVHGPKAVDFEDQFSAYTKSQFSVSTSSCTASLHLSYLYLGIGAGDEVLVPAMTHVATAHAVELTGAKAVFVDAEIETGNINLELIEEKITPKTKAISIVHYLGMPVDMDKLCRIAKKHNLFLVEDCALAIGTYYKNKHAGTFGDTGCFSFYPVKHMTTAEGGMLTTQQETIAKSVKYKKAFGVDRHMGERKLPGSYDVIDLGYNYRMNEIEAVIGIIQLKKVNSFLEKRRENYNYLTEKLLNIPEVNLFKSTHGDFQSSYYCHSIRLTDALVPKRLDIIDYLNTKGVGTSIYYPKPVSDFTYYKNKYGYKPNQFPVAAKIAYNSIALPVGPHLNVEDMHYIADMVKQAITANK